MKCSYCGGLVTWRGPLTDLTHTECASCGRRNCQEVEPGPYDDDWAPNPNNDQGNVGVLGAGQHTNGDHTPMAEPKPSGP